MNEQLWMKSIPGWQAILLGGLFLLIILYGRGWVKQRASAPEKVQGWHLSLFFMGIFLVMIATVSPLADWSLEYYSARAVQHILLTGLIPMCLIITNGFSRMWDGLPTWLQWGVFTRPNSWARRLIASVTQPAFIWVLFVVSIWGWNDVTLIQLTRELEWVHALEFVNLLLISIIYWWHIAGIKPHIHQPMSRTMRMAYAYAGMIPTKLVGFMLLFGTAPGEGTGDVLFRAIGMRFSDPGFAAMIIWMVGGLTYTYTATFFAGQLFDEEDKKPAIAQTLLLDEETWRAPGLYRKDGRR